MTSNAGVPADPARCHVLDDDALAALHGGTAGGPIVCNFGEELEKRLLETSTRDDPQRVRTAVAQLDVAHVGRRDRDRRVEDLLHQRIVSPAWTSRLLTS